jgi:stearoyl-CoA desaturase (delta-9 desaturase)
MITGTIGWFVANAAMGIGNTVGYHRMLTHRSFATREPLWILFTLLGASHSGAPLPWVALHRLHHAKSDTPEDPITPTIGFFNAHGGFLIGSTRPWVVIPFCLLGFGQQLVILWTDLRRIAGTYTPEWYDICPELRGHWLIRLLDVPLVTPALFGVQLLAAWLIGGWWGILWLYLLRLSITNGSWGVNSLCHSPGVGFQRFENGDLSRDVPWLAAITYGEGYHNTHHRFPRSAWYGLGGVDPSWWLIKALARARLVWDIRLPRDIATTLPARALHQRKTRPRPAQDSS